MGARTVLDNKTIIQDFDKDDCIATNEHLCKSIKSIINKLEPVVEKFSKVKFESIRQIDLYELIVNITQLKTHFEDLDVINNEISKFANNISDIALKLLKEKLKEEKPSEFYEQIKFFIDKSLKFDKRASAINDILKEYDVRISNTEYLNIDYLAGVYKDLNSARKNCQGLIKGMYFTHLEDFHDKDRARAFDDGSIREFFPLEKSDLYKAILEEKYRENNEGGD